MAHILVVEDNELVNLLVCEAIEIAGHTTDCVETKAAAEALLGRDSHALVVSDVLLPDGSGYDVAAKAATLGIRTILMSGRPSAQDAVCTVAVAYLEKPFRIGELYELIEQHLGP